MGNAEGHLAPHTAKRATSRNRQAVMLKEIMKEHDTSHTGKLSRKEVKEMAEKILGRVAKGMGGLEYEEIELIMRCGGSNVKVEITHDELPQALAIISIIKEHNAELDRLFKRYDADGSGDLPAVQLKPLLEEVSEGAPVTDADVNYVLKQCEPRGVADPIKKTQLKAAIACWYVHSDADVVRSEDEAQAKKESEERQGKAVSKKANSSQAKKAPQAKKTARQTPSATAHDKKQPPAEQVVDVPKDVIAKISAKDVPGSKEEITSIEAHRKEDVGKADESGRATAEPAAKTALSSDVIEETAGTAQGDANAGDLARAALVAKEDEAPQAKTGEEEDRSLLPKKTEDKAALDNAWRDAQKILDAPKDGTEGQTMIADGAKVVAEESALVVELADGPADVQPTALESLLSRLLPFRVCRTCCRSEGSGQDIKDAEMPISREV